VACSTNFGLFAKATNFGVLISKTGHRAKRLLILIKTRFGVRHHGERFSHEAGQLKEKAKS